MTETKVALRVATGLGGTPKQTALLVSRAERQARRFMVVDWLGQKRPRRRGQRAAEGWGRYSHGG